MNGLELEREGDHVSIRLSGPLGAPQVADLFRQLKEICSPRVTVVLDADGVERIDTAVAQLLLWAALRSARFEVRTASPAFLDAAQALNLPQLLPGNPPSSKNHEH